jgi:hypothetical protein
MGFLVLLPTSCLHQFCTFGARVGNELENMDGHRFALDRYPDVSRQRALTRFGGASLFLDRKSAFLVMTKSLALLSPRLDDLSHR